MKILYLHGWNSACGGVKPTFLASMGHEIVEPEISDEDFESALQTAQRAFDAIQPDLVFGSSRGGALAINLGSADVPLVLLCPAWKRWGSASQVKSQVKILHSPQDEVVPFGDTLELLKNSGLPESHLLITGSDHRLCDEDSLALMNQTVLAMHAS